MTKKQKIKKLMNPANNERFLITGLNGLIGWNLFRRIAENRISFGTYRQPHAAFAGPGFYRLDPEDGPALEKLFSETRPDYLIHSWAMCDLDLCEQMPEMAEKVNVAGTVKLLQAASNYGGLKKLVYISTDHVFDGEKGSYLETDLPSPKHVYGRTKHEAEKLVEKCGLPYLIIRPGLAIGESLQGNKGPRDFLFTRIRAGKPTHYFTDEWRSPIPALELAEKVLRLSLSEAEGIYHVAGGRTFSRFELANRLADEHGLPSHQIFPRLRAEDRWAAIRPKDISLNAAKYQIWENSRSGE